VEEFCESTATTTFADEGSTLMVSYESSHVDDGMKAEMQTICDFLAKPYLLAIGEWSTADLAGANVFNLSIGTTINSGTVTVNPNQVSIWYNKIKGFNLFRGTFVVRIVINAMPFQAGSLIGRYLPQKTSLDSINGNAYGTMHNYNLTTRTQQPHFILTTGEAAAVMEIPYISPTNWYVFPDGVAGNSNYRYDWGTFYLDVMSQLKTGATQPTTVPYSIYGYWKDVELAAPLVPHSGVGPRSKNIKRLKKKSLSVVSKEAEHTEGPLSNILSKVSVASGILAAVPGLTPIMGTVSWASDIASGVARAFGWAKPVSTVAPGIISNQFNRYSATHDGVDAALPLALSYTNSIEIVDGYTPYDGDEMSFNFLKKVAAYIGTISWSKDTSEGTSIYKRQFSPGEIRVQSSKSFGTKTVNFSTGPPIMYLSRCFELWRGSFRVRLKIIKTQFHTGRLQITWTPSSVYTSDIGIYDSSSYALREIIDIRDTSEIELVLPYMSEFNYLSTTLDPSYSGTFQITVLNDLRAPDTVSPDIDIMIFVSGGDDFQFACPVMDEAGSRQMNAFDPQMFAGTADQTQHEVSTTVGNVSSSLDILRAPSLSVGEEFTSTRQLIHRYALNNNVSYNTPHTGCTVDPWFVDVLSADATTNSMTWPGNGADIFSYVSKMFLFYRGSMAVTVNALINPLTTTQGTINALLVRANINNMIATTSNFAKVDTVHSPLNSTCVSSASGVAFNQNNNGIISAVVPYYCATPVSFVTPYRSALNSAGPTQPFVRLDVGTNGNTTAGSQALRVYRSAKEDFQFQFFVGCPPVFDSEA
jgi:hypothetical protein